MKIPVVIPEDRKLKAKIVSEVELGSLSTQVTEPVGVVGVVTGQGGSVSSSGGKFAVLATEDAGANEAGSGSNIGTVTVVDGKEIDQAVSHSSNNAAQNFPKPQRAAATAMANMMEQMKPKERKKKKKKGGSDASASDSGNPSNPT
ncbi:MAG: hypothetical protein Q8807_03385 ['Waltheria sp.' little leaf phytoplasma]|nr:hypothetical protein ['Waltheria sp.' little leaf phytoplasma]